MSPVVKRIADQVVTALADALIRNRADLANYPECQDIWRDENYAPIVIQEFGHDALTQAATRMHVDLVA